MLTVRSMSVFFGVASQPVSRYQQVPIAAEASAIGSVWNVKHSRNDEGSFADSRIAISIFTVDNELRAQNECCDSKCADCQSEPLLHGRR